MKNIFKTTVLVFGLISIVSCSSPTSVAEKALKLVGLGTFVPDVVEKHFGWDSYNTLSLFTDYDNIFDNALIDTDEADHFLEYGDLKETPPKVFFNFSYIMFTKWTLISKDDFNMDIRNIQDYSKYPKTESEIEFFKSIYDDYQLNGQIATWIEGKDIKAYSLRYNIENKHIAEITVLKIPEKGYRVCAFYIE